MDRDSRQKIFVISLCDIETFRETPLCFVESGSWIVGCPKNKRLRAPSNAALSFCLKTLLNSVGRKKISNA